MSVKLDSLVLMRVCVPACTNMIWKKTKKWLDTKFISPFSSIFSPETLFYSIRIHISNIFWWYLVKRDDMPTRNVSPQMKTTKLSQQLPFKIHFNTLILDQIWSKPIIIYEHNDENRIVSDARHIFKQTRPFFRFYQQWNTEHISFCVAALNKVP